MTDPDNERSTRILHAGQLMLMAATALQDENWCQLRDLAAEAAREARCLILLDRQQEKEGAD